MLEKACAGLAPDEHPVIHSDRAATTDGLGGLRSVRGTASSGACRLRDAPRTTPPWGGFFGRLKNEFFYGRDWSGVGLSEFVEMLDAYLRYYNKTRPKEQLGWMSPMQYRRSLGLAA